MANNINIDEASDFGFSIVDEDEIFNANPRVVQKVSVQANQEIKERMAKVEKLIMPFLDNLAKNPEKDYIKWPNRKKSIDDFKKKLHSILS